MLLVSFLMVKNLLILLFDYQNYKDNMELIISIIMLLATVGAIFLAWRNLKKIQEQIELQKQESEQNAIARAWEIVGRKASGNSGKKEALEFLNKKGIPLIGIDLSAKTHGGYVWLSFVDLRGADLFEADLSGTRLIGADLSDADSLVRADLSGALLNGDMSGASLFGTNLLEAILFDANLSHANLSRANLSHANLRGVNLLGATLFFTILDAADFSQSTIDETTNFGPAFLKDKNKLPMFSEEQEDELRITTVLTGQETDIEDADGNKTRYYELKITLDPPKPSKPA